LLALRSIRKCLGSPLLPSSTWLGGYTGGHGTQDMIDEYIATFSIRIQHLNQASSTRDKFTGSQDLVQHILSAPRIFYIRMVAASNKLLKMRECWNMADLTGLMWDCNYGLKLFFRVSFLHLWFMAVTSWYLGLLFRVLYSSAMRKKYNGTGCGHLFIKEQNYFWMNAFIYILCE
jgi:hypothetical protein